ncbi:MAG TPA: hypothetical protein PKC45_14125, partial [Gemmatales bacterium]|nr:hypothetical protein [Gemmatales bacterium]
TVEVGNVGGAPLVIQDFRKTCNCGNIEAEENGAFSAVSEIQVPPGSRRLLRMRFVVDGPPGGAVRQRLGFRSNDPNHPVAEVEFLVERVVAKPTAWPEMVAFDRVLVGTPVTQITEIRDRADLPRAVKGTEATDPAITVERLRPKGDEAETENGRVVMRLAVTIDTSRPREVNGLIRITMPDEGRAPLSIPVSGRVEAPVTCLPPEVFLPRKTAAGPVYAAVVKMRSFAGRIEEVAVQALPPGVSVETTLLGMEAQLRIALQPGEFPAQGDVSQREVRLQVRVETRVHEVVIPVVQVP